MGGKNRIVVDYGDYEGLVMIGCIDNETGIEEDIHVPLYEKNFEVVKKYDGISDFKMLKSLEKNNREGFVCYFKPSGFRMKIKFSEYCRLHSILTKITSRDVWRYLKEGLPLTELLENVPDEFDAWVKEQVSTLKHLYIMFDARCKNIYYSEIDPQPGETRKDVALRILERDKSIRGILFHLYDGRDYSHLIWDKLYPKYVKPFTINDEEGDES